MIGLRCPLWKKFRYPDLPEVWDDEGDGALYEWTKKFRSRLGTRLLRLRRQQRCLTTILALNIAHEKGRIVFDAAFYI